MNKISSFYLNCLKAHLGRIWLTVDLLLQGKEYILTDDESLNISLGVRDTLGVVLEELGMVNDVRGYLVMLPREWYLRGGLIILSRVLGLILIKPLEERGFGF